MFSQRTSLHASTSRISSAPAISLNMQCNVLRIHGIRPAQPSPCQCSVRAHRLPQAERPRMKQFAPPSRNMPAAPRPPFRPCPQYPPIEAVSHPDVQWGKPLAACSANVHPCPGVNKRACLRPHVHAAPPPNALIVLPCVPFAQHLAQACHTPPLSAHAASPSPARIRFAASAPPPRRGFQPRAAQRQGSAAALQLAQRCGAGVHHVLVARVRKALQLRKVLRVPVARDYVHVALI